MRHRFSMLDQIGNDVLAEIPVRTGRGRIAPQLLEQKLRVEDVDPHAGQRHVRIAWDARRIGGLFQERHDAVRLVDGHHAEAGRLHPRHFETADGHVGARVDVLPQHDLIIHLVDMISGQDDDVFRIVARDDVDVLIHRIGRAFVPHRLGHALAGRQDVEALVSFGPEEVPAALEMADQAVRLVLRRHADAPDAGVQCIGKREIDDPRVAAEIHGRLGADIGQLHQSAAAPSGEDICHGVAGERCVGDAGIRQDRVLTSGAAICPAM